MAILIDSTSRVVVQGLTGREGSFHALRNRAYGTCVVAGVTPGKFGHYVEEIPVFDTVRQAVVATSADVSLVFVPPRFAADAIYEAAEAGVRLIVAITEGIPVHAMLRLHGYLRRRGVILIGPNGPGVISPGKANVGIMPPAVFREGRVGIVSRSGTLTYQIAAELSAAGIGQSSAVGIGGDAIAGSSFADILRLFEADPETDAVVMVGEIGGGEEEAAASLYGRELHKPIVAYLAGYTAPPGRQMGHAGAIVSGSSGTAAGKRAALEAAGIRVAASPQEAAGLVAETLSSAGRGRPARRNK